MDSYMDIQKLRLDITGAKLQNDTYEKSPLPLGRWMTEIMALCDWEQTSECWFCGCNPCECKGGK